MLKAAVFVFFMLAGCGSQDWYTAVQKDRATLYHYVYMPSVYIDDAQGCRASGVVLSQKNGIARVLTAAHVVGSDAVVVVGGAGIAGRLGTVLALDAEADLALLEVVGAFPAEAMLVPRGRMAEFGLMTPVVICGFPCHVNEAHITDGGRITSLNYAGSIRYSTATFYGNSGGGVYVRLKDGKYYLIGVAQGVWRNDKSVFLDMGRGCLTTAMLDFIEAHR